MHAKFAELSAARSGGTRFKIEGWHGGFDRVPHMPAAASSKAPTGEHLGFSIFHRFQIPKLLIYVGHAKNKRPPKICSGQLISDTAIGFLAAMFRSKTAGGKEKAKDESALLIKGMEALNIKVQIKETIMGPRVTRYRVLLMNLADSTRLNRNLSQLALAMNLGDKTPSVSNGDEPMTVFIDVPRSKETWSTVSIDNLTNWISKTEYNEAKLNCYVGVSVTGDDVSFDLASAPHLLVGGTTNSGKSVCLHSIILSLLLKHKSENLQLGLIDPKRVEFSSYAKLKNIYEGSIVTEVPAAKELLTTLVGEMDSRYAMFESINASNIAEARAKGKKLPFIVLFIEEMADLVLQDKNIEPLIVRLAQKSRAAGIHLVLATQRPDSETFSGLIRSNIPARIALTVQKGTESSIILDERGAENLLGSGDMLLKVSGETIKRAHGVFVSKENISQILSRVQN